MNPNPPNIKDVAKAAECSIATVSCVLNERGRISEATKVRVRETCQKMGYFPSSAGRNLRSRRTETIGILFYPSCAHIFRDIFYAEMMGGLEEELTQANHNLLLAGYDISTQQQTLPKFIREGSVDGVILMGGCPDEFNQRLRKTPLPFLLLDTDAPGAAVDSITSDGFRAMVDITAYLHNKGHRRMLMIRHCTDNYNEITRCQGFEAETRRLELDSCAETIQVQTTEDAVREIILRLNRPDPITAVCTVNDDMAANILYQLQAAGIRVPEQVSMTGFDNTGFSQNTCPPLTTIHIDRTLMGTEGAKMILSRIQNPGAPVRKQVIPHTLVERESVKTI
ncbi:MAG: LacI family transcriptional regulator [Pontiellaceae bacterium]|jgi:LacI family transcriptional regulator|nr:LacI family transcriptional regulator [Pontiellaceae bacterium]